MKHLFTLLAAVFLSLAGTATTVKLKITYQGNPVTDCDVTIKQGSLELGSDRTDRSGEVSISARSLAGKNIDVYGIKKTSNGEKKWNVNGSVVLDNDNFAHLKMEVYAKEMADASGMSESLIASMWGLALSGENTSGTGSSNSSTSSSSNNKPKKSMLDDDDDDSPLSNKKKSGGAGSSGGGLFSGDGIKVTTETKSSYSSSGPDGTYSSSSSSKSETTLGGDGGFSHSSSSAKSTFDNGAFNATGKSSETSFGNGSASRSTSTTTMDNSGAETKSRSNSADNLGTALDVAETAIAVGSLVKKQKEKKEAENAKASGDNSSSGDGSSSAASLSGDNGGSSSSSKTSSPPVDPETKKLQNKKAEHELAISGYNKEIVDKQAELMTLRAEEDPDTLAFGYKENDLEVVKLKKEKEEIALERVNARIAKTDVSKEKEQEYMDRETKIAFRLKQLEEEEKKSKDLRKDEKKRREAREERLAEKRKEAEKEAKEEANFDTWSKGDLKLRLVNIKRQYGMEQAFNKTCIDKVKKAESNVKLEKMKAKIDKYEKRIAELEAKDDAEKAKKEAEKKN